MKPSASATAAAYAGERGALLQGGDELERVALGEERACNGDASICASDEGAVVEEGRRGRVGMLRAKRQEREVQHKAMAQTYGPPLTA